MAGDELWQSRPPPAARPVPAPAGVAACAGRDGPGQPAGPGAAWLLAPAGVLAAAAEALWGVAVRHLPAVPGPVRVPWPLFALGFAATASFALRVELRNRGHSFSLGGLPLVTGLYLLAPNELVLAGLAGSLLALGLRREPPGRLAFNLSLVLRPTCGRPGCCWCSEASCCSPTGATARCASATSACGGCTPSPRRCRGPARSPPPCWCCWSRPAPCCGPSTPRCCCASAPTAAAAWSAAAPTGASRWPG